MSEPQTGLASGSTAVDLAPLQTKLEAFKKFIAEFVVTDQESYKQLTLAVKDGKGEMKKIGHVLDPGVDHAKEHYDFLRNQRNGYLDGWKNAAIVGDQKCRDWLNEENRKTQQRATDEANAKAAEQRRIADEELRQRTEAAAEAKKQRVDEIRELLRTKQIGKRESARLLKEAGADEEAAKATAAADAEDLKSQPVAPVQAKMERPTVAGVPRTMHYYAELEEPKDASAAKIIDALLASKVEAERIFLLQFIFVDEAAISAYARKAKDSDSVAKAIPGVKAWNSY